MSIFSQNQKTKVASNTFDLTHDVKLSANFGTLTPICVIDTLPGDKYNLTGSAMVRLAPQQAPVMHRANVYLHYFFVPNRILWDQWEEYITGGVDGLAAPVHPNLNWSTTSGTNTLGDYLGLPVDTPNQTYGSSTIVNCLPFNAYQKIYDDYFKDQTFGGDVAWKAVSGSNTANPDLTQLRQRAWEHDYFTSALPWTQRGPEVLLPLGSTASIVPIENDPDERFQFLKGAVAPYNTVTGGTSVGVDTITGQINDGGAIRAYVGVEESHEVDLSTATASSIIELRRAFKLQEWLEKNARGGSRYIESMQVHFGVNSSDKRLQRAEYIGGVQSPIKFSEVLQTSAGESDVQEFTTPQGNMAGHGISVGGSSNMSYYCEEHGYIIGLMSILPKTAYQDGVPKHFLRTIDKFDYAFPSFAHIGEQEIQNQELYITSSSTERTETWGYTPRYAEYKFQNNRVAGDFRGSLDFWHMGRKFAALPPLNIDFIEMDPEEVKRIWAIDPSITGAPPLWIQVLNQVKASRKLPVFGTPRL